MPTYVPVLVVYIIFVIFGFQLGCLDLKEHYERSSVRRKSLMFSDYIMVGLLSLLGPVFWLSIKLRR